MIHVSSKPEIKPKRSGRPIRQYFKSHWKPTWIVMTPGGSEMGITIDDHCFVVLSSNSQGQLAPSNHIPKVAAELIGQLVNNGLLDY